MDDSDGDCMSEEEDAMDGLRDNLSLEDMHWAEVAGSDAAQGLAVAAINVAVPMIVDAAASSSSSGDSAMSPVPVHLPIAAAVTPSSSSTGAWMW